MTCFCWYVDWKFRLQSKRWCDIYFIFPDQWWEMRLINAHQISYKLNAAGKSVAMFGKMIGQNKKQWVICFTQTEQHSMRRIQFGIIFQVHGEFCNLDSVSDEWNSLETYIHTIVLYSVVRIWVESNRVQLPAYSGKIYRQWKWVSFVWLDDCRKVVVYFVSWWT